ncbi:MAG: hypothetical protein WA268_19945 [Xanthobacteraceae bacterium]
MSAWSGSPSAINSRTYYNATAGGYVDVFDVAVHNIASQGFIAFGNSSGATRPTTSPGSPNSGLPLGWIHVDTTNDVIVVWDGANWRNPLSGAKA